MRVELLKPWRYCRAGMVIEPGGGVCDILIRRGIARDVHDKPPASDAPARRKVRKKAKRRAV